MHCVIVILSQNYHFCVDTGIFGPKMLHLVSTAYVAVRSGLLSLTTESVFTSMDSLASSACYEQF